MTAALLLQTMEIDPGIAQTAPPEASQTRPTPQDDALRHIPDYEVLTLAFPPNLARLMVTGRDDYFAAISRDAPALQRLRLLLGFGESLHDGTTEGLHAYFSNPSGTLAPDLLIALREAGLTERAAVVADAIAAFGPTYPVDDRKRSDFFAQSFLRIKDGVVPDPKKPPTAVDLKLRELGRQFADKTKFRAEIEAYVRRDAGLAVALTQARAQLSDTQRLSYLQAQLLPGVSGFGESSAIREQIERMPRNHRTVFVLTLLTGEVFNGGLHQFFSNSSGAFAEYTAQALRDIGMTGPAATIDKALAMFPKPYPVSTQERRRVAFKHDWNKWDDQLDALTGAIDGEDIDGALATYAREQDILPR
ncbi:DMP19 family protein [Bradyrhizobium prioriisuperbiae]|uniref:DMP19 family protein n=1 Tax=Bradyrhizobium prioriisuperbiae TaxID=2854389 RepID=UPI0028EBA7E0|nr:DUF4375 domain-containing protein [Bradyrhizobium prioritasuperba]